MMKSEKEHSQTTNKQLMNENHIEISRTMVRVFNTLSSPVIELIDTPLGKRVVENLNRSLEHFGFLKRFDRAAYISELLYGYMSLQANPALQADLQSCTVCASKLIYCPYCTPESRSHTWIIRITQVVDEGKALGSDQEFWEEVCAFSLPTLIEQINTERMQ